MSGEMWDPWEQEPNTTKEGVVKQGNRVVPTVAMEKITPQVARRLLDEAPANPRWTGTRQARSRHVETLARDMSAGRFYPTSTIVIGETGELLDGYHRLTAIVASGVTLVLPVVRNMAPEAAANFDTNQLPRSLNHSANAVGLKWLSKSNVSKIVKVMIRGLESGPPRWTRQEELDFAVEHRDAIEFTADQFPTNKRAVTVANVQGAVARAWYHVHEEILERFARVLYSGLPEKPEDASVIRLRDFLLTRSDHGGSTGVEVYAKSARAIVALHDRQELKTLHAVSSEPFPLPNETTEGKG